MASFEKPAKGHMGSTIKFSSDEDRNLFLGDLNSKSQIKEIFGSWKFEGIFDINFFKFKEIIIEELLRKKFISENLFNKHGGILEKLHLCLKEDLKNLDESEQNKISVSFYETSSKLKELYYQFIRNEISTYFDDDLFFQEVPTFRFHFPNQTGYNWNDRYHTDIMLGHPPYEINVWLPLTKTYDSNSMRITPFEESMSYLADYKYDFELFAEEVQYNSAFANKLRQSSYSLNMSYGKYIMFDPRCLHCTQHNVTSDTRISMDIRIITKKNMKKYSRDYKTTGRKNMLFTPGNYFSEKPV